MEIKKVITDGFYRKDYVMLDDKIFEKSYVEQFKKFLVNKPDDIKLLEEVLKNYSEKYYPAKLIAKASYKAFPTNDKMIDIIDEKRKMIYKVLNLNQVKNDDAQMVRAMLMFDYLAKNTSYDMMVIEDVFVDYEVLPKFKAWEKEYEEVVATIEKAQHICKTTTVKQEYLDNLKILKQKVNEQTALIEKLEQDTIDQKNRQHLKAVYSVLANKKGVCAEYSKAYQFLLDGIGIENYYVETVNKEQQIGHGFNILKTTIDGDTKYLIADVTKGKNFSKHSPKHSFLAFAMEIEEFFDYHKGDVVDRIQTSEPFTKGTKQEYRKELFTKEFFEHIKQNVVERSELRDQIEYSKNFIKNEHQATQEDENTF